MVSFYVKNMILCQALVILYDDTQLESRNDKLGEGVTTRESWDLLNIIAIEYLA